MSDVTIILQQVEAGEAIAADRLFEAVYSELRQMAAGQMASEQPGQTLQPTALVHEAWLRLAGPANADGFANRRHFFAAAGEAMRRILVDQARRKHAVKRFRKQDPLELDDVATQLSIADDAVLAIDAALEKFAQIHPDKAQLVQLRYFVGLTRDQAAEALRISPRTADRHWIYARAWLQREMAVIDPNYSHTPEKKEVL